jgi:hypothetical protein
MSAKTPSRDADGLTPQERIFIAEYCSNAGNGKKAAEAAGYHGDFSVRGSQLIKRPHIRRVIERTMRARLSKLQLKGFHVLKETACAAFFDCRRLFRADGSLLPVELWPEEVARVIAGFEFKDGAIFKLRFASKLQALELLGRYLRLWEGAGEKPQDRLGEIVDALRSPAQDGEKKDTVN